MYIYTYLYIYIYMYIYIYINVHVVSPQGQRIPARRLGRQKSTRWAKSRRRARYCMLCYVITIVILVIIVITNTIMCYC